MSKSPKEVIGAFRDKGILVQIAQDKKFEITDKFKKNIVENLAVHISNLGLLKLLQILPHVDLNNLASKKVQFLDSLKTHSRLVLSKKLLEQMELEGPLKFLDNLEESYLDKIIEKLDIEISNNTKKVLLSLLKQIPWACKISSHPPLLSNCILLLIHVV